MSETSAQTDPVVGPFSSRDSRSRLDVDRELPSTSHLPLCPRSIYSSKYDDWYTLEGSILDVCPDCLDGIIGRHPFRSQFFRTRRSELRKKCDFSSYWFRLAWELTLEQQRPDLSLIRALASITHTEPECPDTRETHRVWYGLPRPYDDAPISNLHICQADVRTLETLFPTLRGFFTRLSPTTTPHQCALRPSSRRAATYLATLASTHAAAVAARAPADPTPFARLADALAWKQECQQDTQLRNAPWHTCAAIPALTVCEACYDEVVRPARAAGSRLAGAVSRSLGLAFDRSLGRSCQLYSARMRRAWARAVRDDDVLGFAGVVRARRKAEVRLQGRMRALKGRMDEVEARAEERRGWGLSRGDGWGSEVAGGGAVEDVGMGAGLRLEKERLRAEMAAVAREWREWE
ncbi:uncharacterized protein K452DRAFT_228784 [Aplosporella prunicola CBS 121167]|uniref:Uncharacterized protein n=1 Tax=Aplosporella prunicola CBS 121167 TaxID=1176127 RepID=A0A6A6BAH6_9PEZI|nr:uncharacterized protein K452DRAFT_228784 [Aplosporella prunicola CBS 121167]KAF2141209.1 hypothetical protein K452DRAFT_228784 [Aplosporella prunicola CBS 121167]